MSASVRARFAASIGVACNFTAGGESDTIVMRVFTPGELGADQFAADRLFFLSADRLRPVDDESTVSVGVLMLADTLAYRHFGLALQAGQRFSERASCQPARIKSAVFPPPDRCLIDANSLGEKQPC